MGYSSRVGICISKDAADFLDAKIRVLSPALKEEVARLFEDADVKMRNFTENGRVVRGKTATSRSEATLDFFLCL